MAPLLAGWTPGLRLLSYLKEAAACAGLPDSFLQPQKFLTAPFSRLVAYIPNPLGTVALLAFSLWLTVNAVADTPQKPGCIRYTLTIVSRETGG